MDAAEQWLAANDPQYEASRKSWRDLNADGEYETPRQEIPWGTTADLAVLVDTGRGRFVTDVPRRSCDHCHETFVPASSIHRFCSDTCRQRARKARVRNRADYQRAYRAARKAA